MKILFYQIDGDVCKFIYTSPPSGIFRAASCENYMGMVDFLRSSGGSHLLKDVQDIYDKLNDLNANREKERIYRTY